MNIRIDTLGNVVKVYSNSDLLFSFKSVYVSEATNICDSCNMNDICEKNIFGTHSNFMKLVCQKLSIKRRPKITKENAEALIRGIRGKIIKKNLRK